MNENDISRNRNLLKGIARAHALPFIGALGALRVKQASAANGSTLLVDSPYGPIVASNDLTTGLSKVVWKETSSAPSAGTQPRCETVVISRAQPVLGSTPTVGDAINYDVPSESAANLLCLDLCAEKFRVLVPS